MPTRATFLLALAAALVVATTASWAQPNLSGSSLLQEPNGFPPACEQPCYTVEKTFEVYFPDNPMAPGVCRAGDYTYLYTLTHLGGSGPLFFPAVTEFEVAVDVGRVTAAGWIPGPGVEPSSLSGPPVVIGPLDVVSWKFENPPLNAPPAGAQGTDTSDALFLCSPLPPGSAGDTLVSTTGQGFLDAPGSCVGPVAPACELEIDKTCCIPAPSAPGVDVCEGKVLRAVFEVVGGECSETTNTQEGKAQCSGMDPVPGDFGAVDVSVTKDADKIAVDGQIGGAFSIPFGSTFTVTNEVDSNGELKASTKLEITGRGGVQDLTIHTSCSKALRCGDQFGSIRLVEIETTEGGTTVCPDPDADGTRCAPPPQDEGTECTERPVEIVFEYTGSPCQDPLPQPSDKADCEGDPSDAIGDVSITYTGKDPGKFTLAPSSGISAGDTVTFTATGRDEMHSESQFLIADADGVEQSLRLHTSCSQRLACGDEFGALRITGFTQKDGSVVSCEKTDPEPIFRDSCQVPLAPPAPHCTSKIMDLQLAYVGDALGLGCGVTNSQDGKASCTGVADPGSPVSITITKDADKVFASPDAGISAPTTSEVDIVSIQKIENGVVKELASETAFRVHGPNGSQDIVLHTSCSQALNLGDVFGSFVVVGIDRKDEGFVGLGGQVEYQYTVTNRSSEDAVVTVVDDPHGEIVAAPGEIVAAGTSRTFFATRTLLGTTTNRAMATGHTVSGGSCNAPADEVTVTVTLPPRGAFDCSDAKPIDELSMVWKGTDPITIQAWDGDPGSTLLRDVSDGVIAPDDTVTVRGMGGSPNDQVWEIYDETGTILLGRSEFHISCSDDAMNGIEDCGKSQGNGKSDDAGLVDDWAFEGMAGDGVLVCSPDDEAVSPLSSQCGLGFELVGLLPGLGALRRRRGSRSRR